MKSVVRYLEKDLKQRHINLCISVNEVIHILRYDKNRSICGAIDGVHECVITKGLLITKFIEYMMHKIEAVKINFRPSFFWNSINNMAANGMDVYSDDRSETIFAGLGESIYNSDDYDVHVDHLSASHIQMIYHSRLCRKCLGIFLGVLFRCDEKNSMDDIIDQYI